MKQPRSESLFPYETGVHFPRYQLACTTSSIKQNGVALPSQVAEQHLRSRPNADDETISKAGRNAPATFHSPYCAAKTASKRTDVSPLERTHVNVSRGVEAKLKA
jgi:hypothetical protein